MNEIDTHIIFPRSQYLENEATVGKGEQHLSSVVLLGMGSYALRNAK